MNQKIIPLNNYEKNLCEYGGIFGVLLTLTCLVQHFIAAIPGPLTNWMIPAYIFISVSWLLLGLQKYYSVYLLIICALLCAAIEYVHFTHYAFSLVVVLLLLYCIIMTILLMMENIPNRLKSIYDARKKEDDFWTGKI